VASVITLRQGKKIFLEHFFFYAREAGSCSGKKKKKRKDKTRKEKTKCQGLAL